MAASTGLFQWTSEYSVGVAKIDEQHKVLFDLINRLFLSALNRDHTSTVSEILDALIDYARTHFAFEERLLAESRYPVLPDHQQQHLQFTEKIETIALKYREGKVVTFELINFLKHWLNEHILEADMGYTAYLAKPTRRSDDRSLRARAATKKRSLELT